MSCDLQISIHKSKKCTQSIWHTKVAAHYFHSNTINPYPVTFLASIEEKGGNGCLIYKYQLQGLDVKKCKPTWGVLKIELLTNGL